jgi:hypothetical protein
VEYPEASWPQVVAYALHDGPMQTIVSVALELDGLAKAMGSVAPPSSDEVRGGLLRLRAANQDAAKDLREIVRRLSEGTDADDRDGQGFRFEPQLVRTNGVGGSGDAGLTPPEGGGGEVTR